MALVLAPDLDSYLLALGHLPIMGVQENLKKARRAAEAAKAGLSDAPPPKAAAPRAAVAKRPASRPLRLESPSKATTRSTSPASSTATGSGNPASSVSSGGVEADGWKWEYKEGKNGLYTCAWCSNRPYRSMFLIEATDLEGFLCVERDVEGRLYGRCYDCCRGRGRHGGLDIYAHLVPETSLLTEEMLAKIFKKECNRRHLCCRIIYDS